MKPLGELAYQAFNSGIYEQYPFADLDEAVKRRWEQVESTIFDVCSEWKQPTGLWVTICGTPDFVVLSRVTRVYEWHGWKYQFESHGPEFAISEADARRLVEALGGTWPEEKPNV